MAYSTRVRYGLRLLVRLALQGGSRRVSLSEVAREEGVSAKYLEQIVRLLKPLGILRSVRGIRGGYSLLTDPAAISMDRVFTSLGALEMPVPCGGDAIPCDRVDVCATRPFWMGLDGHMREYLRGISLADIVAGAPQSGPEFRSIPVLPGKDRKKVLPPNCSPARPAK
ncbi:MAG: Rrf2 family transcriptional regulator [Deltaproteobacteria bacterium]|jgi:Rrf2 family protein|nr:Rrf2 family transcriptional regulator [Deltaproteobacteria bacterium]